MAAPKDWFTAQRVAYEAWLHDCCVIEQDILKMQTSAQLSVLWASWKGYAAPKGWLEYYPLRNDLYAQLVRGNRFPVLCGKSGVRFYRISLKNE